MYRLSYMGTSSRLTSLLTARKGCLVMRLMLIYVIIIPLLPSSKMFFRFSTFPPFQNNTAITVIFCYKVNGLVVKPSVPLQQSPRNNSVRADEITKSIVY